MKGRVFSSPVCGFSKAHDRGRRFPQRLQVLGAHRAGPDHVKVPQQTVGSNLGWTSTETTSQPRQASSRLHMMHSCRVMGGSGRRGSWSDESMAFMEG